MTFITLSSGCGRQCLSADPKFRDDRAVTFDVGAVKVVEQAAALTDHLVHAKTAVIVLRMDFQVLGELTDALGEDGDLDLGGSGVGLVSAVVLDNGGLLVFGDHSFQFLSAIHSYRLSRGENA